METGKNKTPGTADSMDKNAGDLPARCECCCFRDAKEMTYNTLKDAVSEAVIAFAESNGCSLEVKCRAELRPSMHGAEVTIRNFLVKIGNETD